MKLTKYAAVALLASCTPAMAQQATCMPTEELFKVLHGRFQEQPLFAGMTQQGVSIQAWGNPSGDTWTIIAVRPDGVSCAVASGSGWILNQALTGDPA